MSVLKQKPGLSQQLRLTLGVMLIGIAVVITVVVKGVWSI